MHTEELIASLGALAQDHLDRERKTMMRLRAKREKQLIRMLDSTAGLYGDLQAA